MGDRRVIHLVDDEESIRKAASFALKTAGYDVVTYASGVEFLKEAKSAAVGCVILDVRMPEMDGLEIQAAMAARGVNMPIAYDLGCSSRTVEVHRASLMAKLEVRNLSEALRIAFAAGMGRKPK